MLLNDLGPTFVKLGQILSTRADLLPAEFIEELATLQDQVEPFPLEDMYAQIRESLGREASGALHADRSRAAGGGVASPRCTGR